MNIATKSRIILLVLLTFLYGQLHADGSITLKQIEGPVSYPLWSKKFEVMGHFNSVWISSDEQHGWAVGDSGTILKYDAKREGGQWTGIHPRYKITPNDLFALWMDDSGEHGWAVGDSGTILEYDAKRESGQWKVIHPQEQITSSALLALWMDDSGEHGWAVGDSGTILEYDAKRESGQWKSIHPQNPITSSALFALWMDDSGEHGWAVGDSGTILGYDAKRESGQWKSIHPQNPITSSALLALWMDDSGEHGWAVGIEGTIVEYDTKREGEQWKEKDKQAEWYLTLNDLNALWMNDSGEHGWAVGSLGIILEYNAKREGEQWKVIHQSRRISILRKNINPQGNLTSSSLHALWMDDSGEHGWAVGSRGTVLQYKREIMFPPECNTSKQDTLSELNGRIQLKFKYKVHDIGVELINVSKDSIDSIDLKQSRNQLLTYIEGKDTTDWTFEFGDTSKLVSDFQEDKCYLKFIVYFKEVPLDVTYITETFYLKTWPLKYKIALGIALLFGFNLLMVLLSIPFSKLRTFILHPIGSKILGLVVGKYLIIDALLHFVKIIRLGFFRDYREKLKEASYIERWEQTIYIPPRIEIPGDTKDNTWQDILKIVLNGPKRRLWLIKGKSGLGKTALLENWVKLALELGKTPIYIPLGSDLEPKEEAGALIEQYGDIDVKPDVALDLLKRGGFLILMDGLNEDRNPDVTREFVRQVYKRNHVIVTSQFDPGWEKSLRIEEIDLKPFGKEQLEAIMAPDWVEKLLESDFKELAKLPHTAQLIGEYIKDNQALPALHLDIYRNLRIDFDRDTQAINLEEKTWQMFIQNTKLFKADNKMPPELCKSAVEYGILTRQMDQYQFRHERVFRYFAACYLNRHDKKPLEEWHQQLEPRLGRNYWADTLEFWSEMYAEAAIENQTGESDFLAFLQESGRFECHIFKERLYPLYERVVDSGKLPENPAFIKWAANLMANC